GAARRRRQIGKLTAIDSVGVDDDLTLGGLPEDLGELDDGRQAAADEVVEHRPGADGWQLIDVANHDEVGFPGQGSGKGSKERDVDHRGLVDDDDVGVDGIAEAALEAAALWLKLEQAMQGLDALPGALRQSLGGAASRCGQSNAAARL